MMKKKLILVRGVPGSGKSTFAEKIYTEIDESNGKVALYEADMFLQDAAGNYRYHPSLMTAAHKMCHAQTEFALFDGYNVIVANTFVGEWEFAEYVKIAKRQDAELIIYETKTQYQNIHGVPPEKVQDMKNRFVSEQAIRETYGDVFTYHYVGE